MTEQSRQDSSCKERDPKYDRDFELEVFTRAFQVLVAVVRARFHLSYNLLSTRICKIIFNVLIFGYCDQRQAAALGSATIRRAIGMKTEIEYLQSLWPMRHYLVTCGNADGKANIITVSFCMPVSKAPPLLACAIGERTFSRSLIDGAGEFAVNVPAAELKAAIYFCGFHSGREIDKFEKTGLTPKPARIIKAPVIDECLAHMECRVVDRVKTGDKILFVGEVIEAYADEAVLAGKLRLEYAAGDFPRGIYPTRFVEQ